MVFCFFVILYSCFPLQKYNELSISSCHFDHAVSKAEYNNVSYLYSTGEDPDGDGWYDDYYGDTDEFGVTQYLGDDIAGTQYDVAHVKWKLSWLMPSIDQFRELVNNCTNEWTTQNGVYGRKFTSTLNEGSIFLPVTGVYFGKELSGTDAGCYWSSSQDPTQPGDASDLYFRKDVLSYIYGNGRYMGMSVRPIWIYK